MARKARRYFPRRPTARPRQAPTERQDRIDVAARQLLGPHTPAEPHARLADCATLLEEADQAGSLDPSPVNLARYRQARAEWEVAQRAVELAAGPDRPEA